MSILLMFSIFVCLFVPTKRELRKNVRVIDEWEDDMEDFINLVVAHANCVISLGWDEGTSTSRRGDKF